MHKIPVHIITGFLGAGKSTLLLRLLEKKPADEKWAILINEFGKISIDGKTFQAEASTDALFEIAGGCICCSAQAYFAENLGKILSMNRFHRILIEPSGLGGIDQIIPLIDSFAQLQLQPVVCIVDLAMLKIPRLRLLPLYKRQIEKADLILFSKTDLREKTELKRLKEQFSSDFPEKKVVSYGEIAIQYSSPSAHPPPSANWLYPPIMPLLPLGKEGYREFCLTIPGHRQVDPDKLIELLGKDATIVRAKGYIYTGIGWLLFNFTLTGNSIEMCRQRAESELAIILDLQETTDLASLQTQIEALFY